MKITRTEIPAIDEFSDREIIWIFWKSFAHKRADGVNQKKSVMKQYLSFSDEIREKVKRLHTESESHLLPEEEIEWIDSDNIRLLRWIKDCCTPLPHYPTHSSIYEQPPYPDPFISPPPLEFDPAPSPLGNDPVPDAALYRYLITTIDQWDVTLETKRSSLEKIKIAWSELLRKDSKLKWLHKNNNSQVEWAWAYLNEYMEKHTQPLQNIYSPTNTEETYNAILSTFDTWRGDTGFIFNLQTGMKQAWAQQKYRTALKKNNKKQSTYVLGEGTISHLNELAEANNVNLNKMLEHIINEAYKNLKRKA